MIFRFVLIEKWCGRY